MIGTFYDLDGRITGSFAASSQELFDFNMDGKQYVNGDFDSLTHYILNGKPTERPASPVTLSDLTLLGVPAGSTLMINGERYSAEGNVELEFPLPGTYRLRVECFPYKDWEGEVVV